MLIAPKYQDVVDQLTHAFKHRYENLGSGQVTMVGILFARPSSPLAKAEIIPALDDFSYRSGNNIDFFLPGYCLGPKPGANQLEDGSNAHFEQVKGSRGDFWSFCPELFEGFRSHLQSLTKWRYSGGAELVLSNARYNQKINTAELDFSSTIVCQLDTMKAEKAIGSVEMFFESVFQHAEEFDGIDPTWGYSDKQGQKISQSALKRFILSLLPKGIGQEAQKAIHFVARDTRA